MGAPLRPRQNRLIISSEASCTSASPVLTRDQWVQGESSSLLQRVFGGRVAPLVAHFSKHGALSKADVEELRRLIEELDDGRK